MGYPTCVPRYKMAGCLYVYSSRRDWEGQAGSVANCKVITFMCRTGVLCVDPWCSRGVGTGGAEGAVDPP